MNVSRNRNILPSIWVVALILFSATFPSGQLLATPIGINLATSSVVITHDPLPGVLPAHFVGAAGNVTH